MPSLPFEKIEFARTELPAKFTLSGVTATPSPPLKAMRFDAPTSVPPMIVLEELAVLMPGPVFGTAAVPAAFSPMRLPFTTLPTGNAVRMEKAMPVLLPEMTLPAPGAVPPIRWFEPSMRTPSALPPSATEPVMSVPM